MKTALASSFHCTDKRFKLAHLVPKLVLVAVRRQLVELHRVVAGLYLVAASGAGDLGLLLGPQSPQHEEEEDAADYVADQCETQECASLRDSTFTSALCSPQ
jgi:hypothetical protein